ncbi:hypothetical protein H310_08357 [Aphanomyces invadans]|uniref:Reverse transcriptase RNase H-like domain-containing protein n=1 Tax=Aphanomyces invadans TaxID=157072 RepID=A0A024TZT3_9STRA|nr:hypothetical protein H310_08357 [Aphanomyces invadans]ETV98857.1 hypothetical protein H310_08357 [Aphanomyces invadans]|eukprot:XP_008872285.1 hypothetical protein H310_08357 [Aphanomyces invadans]
MVRMLGKTLPLTCSPRLLNVMPCIKKSLSSRVKTVPWRKPWRKPSVIRRPTSLRKSAQPASATKRQAIKLDVPKYGGLPSQQPLRWVQQVTKAADALNIGDDDLTCEEDFSFEPFDDFVDHLKAAFVPANSYFRFRAEYFSAKQGKAFDSQLFRTRPSTFEDAVSIDLAEDFSVTQARGVKVRDSSDMEVSAILPTGSDPSILVDREMEVLGTLILCQIGSMLSFSSRIPGYDRLFRVLVDCGASENYARRASIRENRSIYDDGDGQVVTSSKVVVTLATVVEGFASTESFYVIDLDDRWDLVLGTQRLEAHQPWIGWRSKTMHKAALANPPSDLGVMSNELTLLHGPATQFVTRPAPSSTRLATESAAIGDAAKTGDDVRRTTAHRRDTNAFVLSVCDLTELPRTAAEIVTLPEMSYISFVRALRGAVNVSIALIRNAHELHLMVSSTTDDPVEESAFRPSSSVWKELETNPYFDLVREFQDVFPDSCPGVSPKDKSWPLPRDQVSFIDEFFAARKKTGHVRESKSPHSNPTFSERGHIPAQTPIPRKDVILDSMGQSIIFSAIDLRDGFYQILMNVLDIEKTAGLKNVPATFNRVVTEKLRPLREFAPSYLEDVYIHCRATATSSDVEAHRSHLRQEFQALRDPCLFANLSKCLFGVPEILVLGDYVASKDVAPIRPSSVLELRSWMGLATYLPKFSANFADVACPMTRLLGKDTMSSRLSSKFSSSSHGSGHKNVKTLESIKSSLTSAPILALPDYSRPFFVVCDASVRAIGCCLMQRNALGRERPVSFQPRQLHKSEKNYPVHDLEILAMYYALKKFRIYLLGSSEFEVYTDHASLRTAINSPHLSPRMSRWLTCRRACRAGSHLLSRIRAAYAADVTLRPIIEHL